MLGKLFKQDSPLEILLARQLTWKKIEYGREFKFHPERRWRFDFVLPQYRVGIECEGGIHSGGRHTRGLGYEKDVEKYNEAIIHGWRLLRFTHGMITCGYALNCIERIIKAVEQENAERQPGRSSGVLGACDAGRVLNVEQSD